MACLALFPIQPMSSNIKSFFAGFSYAIKGIRTAIQTERNMRVHVCVASYVLFFSLFYPFGAIEYALLFLCIGGVIALELVNTAIEQAVKQPDPAHWRAAGIAKDVAAGAVLVYSIAAVAIGVALFWQPLVLMQMIRWFSKHSIACILLAVSLFLSIHFIFNTKRKGK